MAYGWAQLSFVERWRLNAVRGLVIGMYRPEDRTLFDLRLRPGEGNVGKIDGVVELQLIDAGDIIREKRITLLARTPVVVRVVASDVSPADGAPALAVESRPGNQRRRLQPGSMVQGTLVDKDETTAMVDAGMPIVVELPESAGAFQASQAIRFTVAEIPKGFFVV